MLIAGYAGIGKSSVVSELHRILVPPRGLFASGKFDQYKRDIPYVPFAQAFQSLVRNLLSQSDAEVEPWRHALLEALGPNGQLIVNLIPELALIIGEQPRRFSRRRMRKTASRSYFDVFSAYSRGPSIRSRCLSTICNGSIRRRSTCWHISSRIRT
jgi:predicted ATPase